MTIPRYKKIHNFFLKLFAIVTSLFVFSGCGKMFTMGSGFQVDENLNGAFALPSSEGFLKAQVVLQKCTTCHGPGGSMSSKSFVFATENAAFSTPWFLRGDIHSPALVRSIGSGSASANMPPNGSWDTADYDILKNWILSSAQVPAALDPSIEGTVINENPNSQLVCSNEKDVGASDNNRLAKYQVINTLKMLFGDNIISLVGVANSGDSATMSISSGTVSLSNLTKNVVINWPSVANTTYHVRLTDSTDTKAVADTYDPNPRFPLTPNGIYLYVDNHPTNTISFKVIPGHSYKIWMHNVKDNVIGPAQELYFSTSATPTSTPAGTIAAEFENLPEDGVAWRFEKQTLNFSKTHAQNYMDLAFAVSESVFNDVTKRTAVFGSCANSIVSSAGCIDSYLEKFAKLILRRPLSDEEKTKAKKIFYSNDEVGEGFIRVLAYHLLHPDFLVRWELGPKLSGSGPLNESEKLFQITNYELASKLAFLVTDTGPDAELIAKADDGTISSDSVMKAQVIRLMGTPKAREKFNNFGFYWAEDSLNFANSSMPAAFLANLDVPSLGAAAAQETQKFMEYMIWDGQKNFPDLMSSQMSFASDPTLANIYGHAPAGITPAKFSENRKGLFNRMPFLYSMTSRSSIIQRGVKFRKNVLCENIPSPPNAVFLKRNEDAVTDEVAISLSTRDVVAHMTKGSSCISCHALINPTGNMFENFDSLARYRVKENTFTSAGVVANTFNINTEAKVPLWTGSQVSTKNYSDFVPQVVNTNSVKSCFSKKVVSYSNAIKHLSAKDACKVKKVFDEISKSDGKIFNAIVSSVANPSAKYRRVEP